MPSFSPSFLRYFEQLSQNNTTHWFDQNRKWYEKDIKLPFQDFIDELIIQLRMIDKDIHIEPSEAIFRINNDIRFAKEKIPYKTWMSANISAMGKRVKEYPGFFLQTNHEKLILAGGVYSPEKESLYQIRQQIAQDPYGFKKVLEQSKFKTVFGEFRGDQHIQLPSEFREAALIVPEIAFKQFHFKLELAPDFILQERLPQCIREQFEAAAEMHQFLKRAYKYSLAA